MSQIIDLIQQLYKFAPQLIGAGYDNCLTHLKELIGLDIIEFPSGTKFETWTVPDEWVVKEAWVKDPSGNKIIEWKNDLSLMVYSAPTHGTLKREELKAHLYINKDLPDATHYEHSFYEKRWGFSIPYNKMFDKEGKDLLPEGEYEVFIDTEFKPSVMKLGVHTVSSKNHKGSNYAYEENNPNQRQILLFAHLDHPWQANDNLAGVACLADLALRLKDKYEHTIKIIFCPETIGSIAYALTQDISKVDFMIAVDCIGTDTQPTIHWSYDADNRINRIAHLAMMMGDESFGMNRFRATIGSDEYVFNDPKIGIPGLMITRHPYPEYHTSADTPEIIKEESITRVQKAIENIIDIYEKDFIPVRNFKAPLFRTKYKVQSPIQQINSQLDYFIYNINGKSWLSEIIDAHQLNWRFCYELLLKLEADELISRFNPSEGKVKKTRRKKQKTV